MSSRVGPDLWIKPFRAHSGCDCTDTLVDDLIEVTKQMLQHLEMMASKLNLRIMIDSQNFFISANWITNEDRTTFSNELCTKEHTRKHREECGSLTKENVPKPTKNYVLHHPESCISPLLDADFLKTHQSIIGACQ